MIEKSSGSAVLKLGLRYDTEFIIYDDINSAELPTIRVMLFQQPSSVLDRGS